MSVGHPFDLWEKAVIANNEDDLLNSAGLLKESAAAFFSASGEERNQAGKAYLEYSTVMDALASVQRGRLFSRKFQYDDSLSEFTRASEIFRATIHFGFLSAYESGCATLENALPEKDPQEQFQALKNAIAFFEQSKLGLGLRDDKHSLLNVIDAMLNYSISLALLSESKSLKLAGDLRESRKKIDLSKSLKKEHEAYARKAGRLPFQIDYLPLNDWKRAKTGGYVASFPEANSIWLGNIGCNPVVVETLGGHNIGLQLPPGEAMSLPLDSSVKGRIRVEYRDLTSGRRYDEGCLMAI